MSKNAKPRKKYRARSMTYVSPLANRPLSENEIARMHRQIDQARLQIRLSSADRTATDTLATYFGYGYILADNFERGDELKDRFKKGLQALYRTRWSLDLRRKPSKEDLAVIDEVSDYAADELSTVDTRTIAQLEAFFAKHAKKLFDIALEEIGGNQMALVTRSEYDRMLSEGLTPAQALKPPADLPEEAAESVQKH